MSPGSWRGALAWILALALGWVALAAFDYRARDPDSRLYSEIAAGMAVGPVATWIAPEFPPGWYMSGLFREHPAGLFVPAAALGALGYPPAQAAYAMNAVYQVLGIVLLQRLVATLVPGLEAKALGWLIQLLPIAFTFRVRANHEAALLLCLLLALYGTERSRHEPRWALLTVAGLVGLLLVKGIMAAFGPALCVLWLLIRRLTRPAESRGEHSRPTETSRTSSDRGAWLGIAAGAFAMGATAAAYELLYRAAAGEPFWSFYVSRQLGVAAATGAAASGLLGKTYNVVFYLGRLVWFAFPWSVFLLVAWWRLRVRSPSAMQSAGPDPGAGAGARAGGLFATAVVGLYVGLFSLSDRRADRYIFPAYYAVGAAGGVLALRAAPSLRRLAERLDRAWVPAAVWAAAFAAHLLAGRLGLPTVKLWAP